MTNVGIFLNVFARMEYATAAAAAKRRKKISHSTKEAHFDNRQKLLVLDVDVLLTYVAAEGDNRIFKRLFCDEFLEFCFQRFNVGVWTSTTSILSLNG
ncbi:putative FCP1 domain, HAD superfamily protein [Helianthus anomalus]